MRPTTFGTTIDQPQPLLNSVSFLYKLNQITSTWGTFKLFRKFDVKNYTVTISFKKNFSKKREIIFIYSIFKPLLTNS